MVQEALSQNAFFVVKRNQKGGKWEEERQNLNRAGADQMVMVPVRSGNQPAIGALELYYRGEAPEVTSEFRAHARNAALEILALLMQKAGSLPLSSIFNNAQKILDSSGANFMFLSLLPGNQVVKVVEYGTAIFLDEPYPPRSTFPTDMAEFGEGTALKYRVRDPNLPDAARAAMTVYGAAAMLCLPLIVKGKPFGTVTIYNTLEGRRFQSDEMSLAWTLVAQAAAALENARLYRDLEQSLSDLRQAQASLVQAARLSTMGELAAVVAHQINNPLTTIMVDAELFLQDLKPSDPMYEGLTAIYRSGQRAHAVVKRLLSTARRGSPSEPLQWIEVHETIHHTLELVTTHIERSKVSLNIDLDETQPTFTKGAPGHLEDLWLNLLLNARDALVDIPGATIEIRSQRRDGTLEVAIQDNGAGIPDGILKSIFEPFFTTKPPGEGTGLGLYICKQIVDQCQGIIQVETAPGKGTSFRISLPVQTEHDD
jgi:signal transduction histidine kinase